MSSDLVSNNPIGVMDSGIGGISVLNHIHHLLPNESIHYVADSLHAPYGNKQTAQITKRCFAIAEFLIKQDVKALVVACNTATAAAIRLMRSRYNLPIIGMEPAVKPATQASKSGVVGVLATVEMIRSAQYAALLANYGAEVKVIAQGCEGLVECVEKNQLTQVTTQKLLQHYLMPLLDAGADTIVLGCTHYPFLRPLIEKIAGRGVTVIDTGAAVSLQLQSTLKAQNLLAMSGHHAIIRCWTNSPLAGAEKMIEQLIAGAAKISKLDASV